MAPLALPTPDPEGLLPPRPAGGPEPDPDEGADTAADDDLFDRLKREFEVDLEARGEWAEEAEASAAFAAGWQWDDDALKILAEQQRPVVTFNRVDPVLDVVAGAEIGNRQDIVAFPREIGDARASEVGTAAIDWVRDRSQAGAEESQAFRDLITGGMGWIDTRVDYLEDEAGAIEIERVDPLHMVWDHAAQKRNLKDARRLWRVKIMDRAEAKALYPDADEHLLDAAWSGVELGEEPARRVKDDRLTRDYRADNAASGHEPGEQVRLIQAQWWERERVAVVTDLVTGERAEMPPGRATMLQGIDRYRVANRTRKRWRWAILGGEVLDQGELAPAGGFHTQCMTGKWDPKRRCWYGMVRAMMDPQRWANKWLAQTMHILNTQGKGGVVVEDGAFVDPAKAQADWSKSTAWIEATPGAIAGQRYAEKPVGQVPPDLHQLLPFALQSIRDCAGVPLELLGQQVAADMSGVLEYQRKQAGMAILAGFFDALQLYRQRHGKILFGFIREFLADGRLIRVVGKEQARYVPLILDPQAAEYDIVVDESPTAPNQRERTWQLLQPLLSMFSAMSVPPDFWVELIKNSPLPASLGERLAEIMQQAAQQQPSPEDQAVKQLALRKAAANVAKAEAEVGETEATAVQKRTGAVLNLARAKETGERVSLDALEQARETELARMAGPNVHVTELM